MNFNIYFPLHTMLYLVYHKCVFLSRKKCETFQTIVLLLQGNGKQPLYAIILTQHPWQYHPLHSSRWRALSVLPILFCGDNVLGGEQQQEQKGQVRCSVADKLHEGFADKEAIATLGSDEVTEGKNRVEEADKHTGDEFSCPVASPPPWKLIIPPGCKQLLTVWLSHEL